MRRPVMCREFQASYTATCLVWR